MSLPDLDSEGYLPPGIHAASLTEVRARFDAGSAARQRQSELLRQVVEAAKQYPSIKRVLLWGSFVTAKTEPNDLDYSAVVSVDHHGTQIAAEHRRFFVPFEARQYYGIDKSYLVIPDYPLDYYVEKLDFACHARGRSAHGIVEISIRGEFMGEMP